MVITGVEDAPCNSRRSSSTLGFGIFFRRGDASSAEVLWPDQRCCISAHAVAARYTFSH